MKRLYEDSITIEILMGNYFFDPTTGSVLDIEKHIIVNLNDLFLSKCIVVSEDQGIVFASSINGICYLFDIKNRKILSKLRLHGVSVYNGTRINNTKKIAIMTDKAFYILECNFENIVIVVEKNLPPQYKLPANYSICWPWIYIPFGSESLQYDTLSDKFLSSSDSISEHSKFIKEKNRENNLRSNQKAKKSLKEGNFPINKGLTIRKRLKLRNWRKSCNGVNSFVKELYNNYMSVILYAVYKRLGTRAIRTSTINRYEAIDIASWIAETYRIKSTASWINKIQKKDYHACICYLYSEMRKRYTS